MKVAEEILKSSFQNEYFIVYFEEMKKHKEVFDTIINAINNARKDCIEECAKKFPSSIRNRESILSLINELK